MNIHVLSGWRVMSDLLLWYWMMCFSPSRLTQVFNTVFSRLCVLFPPSRYAYNVCYFLLDDNVCGCQMFICLSHFLLHSCYINNDIKICALFLNAITMWLTTQLINSTNFLYTFNFVKILGYWYVVIRYLFCLS